MADIALSLASKVAEFLVAPVSRRCSYVIFFDSYVRQLKDEIEELGDARDRVQHSVDEALDNTKQIKAVERWAKDVETVANKARGTLEHDGIAKKTCFCGWLPSPKARYRFGKEASRTVKEIQALIARGQFEKFDFENPPLGLVGGASNVNSSAGDEGDTISDSRASIFQGIMKALDDEKLKVIGVYGPGGVGKTTLLEQIEKKLKKEGRLFHKIVKAKVSRTPDLKKIQDNIAYAFDLNLKDEKSEEGRRDRLYLTIRSHPTMKFLIILDDLWDELDLKAVGIPLGDESRGCKLLLASRFKDVLKQKMRADPTIHLEGLNIDEAFRLFEKTVGDKLEDEELKRIAPQMVKKLAGLPLLITLVASTLKYSGVSAWKNALTQIDESKIDTIVKLSYDHLKSEDAKAFFLFCGLIGGTIQVETLLGLGMGLGLFERFNNVIEDSRDRLNAMLDELRSIGLLLDGGDDNENVTIHDLYSEVVVSTPFRGRDSIMMNNNYGPWSNEKFEKCWAICLVNVVSGRLVELMPRRFTNLKILMLSQPEDLDGWPTHRHDVIDCCKLDFTYMMELRVLYLRSMHIITLPSSIEILGNLRSLYLDNCLVGNVALLGKVKALQILNFAGSAIDRLPKEIGELTNLRLLNLSNCNMLKIIEPGVLKSLINLEELHMKKSFDQWLGNDEISSESSNARFAELKSLTKLTTLEISIPDPTVLLKDGDQPFGNLIKFWINIGNLDGREFEGLRTMKLKLEGCDSILSKEWVQKTLQKTQYLHLDGLREFKKSAHELCNQGFRQLKHLDIDNSPSIKYIANSSDGLPLTAFTILESLFLENLINLENICNGLVSLECFNKLKVVHIKKCHRLKNLWFPLEMQRLVHLEEIQVCECDSMQAIITYDARKVEVATDDIVELPNVRRLDLHKLPNMTSFCIGAEGAPIQVAFPRLEALHITGIGYIKMIWDYHVTLSLSRYFQHLKTVDVTHCDKLSNMFTPIIVGNLIELTKLRISNCKMLTEVISDEGCKVGPVVTFKKLKYMELEELMGLTCFSSGRYTLMFPLLEDVIVTGCLNMKFFSEAPIRAPKLKREQLSTGMWFWNGKTKIAEQNMSIEMATADGVEFMHLSRFSGLTEKWHSKLVPIKSSWQVKSLVVDICSSFLNAIPSKLMLVLDKIHTLQVQDCEMLEEIFDLEGLEAKESTWVLPQLWCLNLFNLPKLRVLWNKDLQGMLCFSSLSYLTLYHCNNLRHVFAPSMARCLPTLQWMEIKECDRMEGVIGEEEGERSAGGKITFPILRWMELERLPSMTSFLPGNHHTLEYPMLQELTIAHCPKMITFIWRSFMQIERGISIPFTLQVLFPPLKSMVLSHMDNSSKILVDSSQHFKKMDAFEKLRLEF